jgi:hypothetical protein
MSAKCQWAFFVSNYDCENYLDNSGINRGETFVLCYVNFPTKVEGLGFY